MPPLDDSRRGGGVTRLDGRGPSSRTLATSSNESYVSELQARLVCYVGNASLYSTGTFLLLACSPDNHTFGGLDFASQIGILSLTLQSSSPDGGSEMALLIIPIVVLAVACAVNHALVNRAIRKQQAGRRWSLLVDQLDLLFDVNA